ncbi:unnamed protein product [Effrenium voratum]|uniref:Uncharacterized protein n=1 Tax=Effrenium voratum TaxID=2562239 RepID=A0AA36J9U5_9DINO|nr:unnamed protein product [Effrenium voratum]CAJ1401146.1 unnamed protein product [Effrenium voratum]CAJ1446882.1 unnamed protein product [Effrenium voratum]|eukprot:CAMPEP_0181464866 /NCGR_PEP_ID=MMETSP1110-20121109/35654_1 /TAXON_ID=174948 /ORGANISM="Symbiodinium sp., Strain CCMP421" /LENGTH=240 /DNA_ID=CAMNT_0023589615 /DNA_START=44 /DNA_END=766 /DNA_ORIENTATION=-
MAMAKSLVAFFAAWAAVAWAEAIELDLPDDCEGCQGLNLLQRKASQDAKANETLHWQGARETGNICMWSNCEPHLGPTECYHFRCVCRTDFVYSEFVKQCVHRYTPEGMKVVSPQDTGATCFFNDCQAKFTVCSDSKCLCIPGFIYFADQGSYGGCQRDPNLFPPNQVWSPSDDLHRWQEQQQQQQQQQQQPPSPPPQQEQQDHQTASSSSCTSHPACSGLAGNCCPNDLGLSLSCCLSR